MNLLFKLRTGKIQAEIMTVSQMLFYKAAGALRRQHTIHNPQTVTTWLPLSAHASHHGIAPLGPLLLRDFILFPGYTGSQASSKSVREKSSGDRLRGKWEEKALF